MDYEQLRCLGKSFLTWRFKTTDAGFGGALKYKQRPTIIPVLAVFHNAVVCISWIYGLSLLPLEKRRSINFGLYIQLLCHVFQFSSRTLWLSSILFEFSLFQKQINIPLEVQKIISVPSFPIHVSYSFLNSCYIFENVGSNLTFKEYTWIFSLFD
jgi:hypothetical protein